MKVKLLRKLRKEAKKKIFVQREYDEYKVLELYLDGHTGYCGNPLPVYRRKELAIARCNKERRDYILSQIKRRIY